MAMASIFDTLMEVGRDTRLVLPSTYDEQVRAQAKRLPNLGASPAAVPAAPVAAPPTGAGYGVGKWLGKMAGRFGPAAGLGAMGFGIADQAAAIQADPESKSMVERGLQLASGADVTGFGGWLGRKLTGRPEPTAPIMAPTISPAVDVPAATGIPAPRGFQSEVRAVDNALMATPTQAISPFTSRLTSMGADEIRGTGIPVAGTGAMVNNATGQVTQFDNRGDPGFGVAHQMVSAGEYDRMRGAPPRSEDPSTPARTWMGAAVGAKMNINRRANDARQAAGYAKLGADIALRRDATAAAREGHYLTAATAREKTAAESVGRGATAAKTGAEAVALGARINIAAAEPDPIKRAAILAGHNPPSDTNVFLPTMDPNKIDVGNRATGAVQRVVPKPAAQVATKADFDADVKRMGSKDAVLRLYKERNITPPKE